MNCFNCAGSNTRNFMVNDCQTKNLRLSIWECVDCCVAWQHPMSAWVESKVFSTLYEQQEEDSYFDVTKQQQVSRMQMDFIESLRRDPRTLLDVGAGVGTFVKEARRRGWDGIGIEPTAAAVAKSDGSVRLGTIPDLAPSEKFDVVTLWDVIEHVPDPAGLLRDASKRLNDGGWLVVETGNYQSSDRIVCREDWYLWFSDHRWFFSPASLQKLLSQEGLQNLTMSEKTLRPWHHPENLSRPKLLYSLLKKAAHQPWTAVELARTGKQLWHAYGSWPWVEIPIMTIAAQKGIAS